MSKIIGGCNSVYNSLFIWYNHNVIDDKLFQKVGKMTEYEIYQINKDRDVNRIMFWDYDTAIKVNAGEFDTSIYDEVYWDIRDFKSLDEMFEVFNCDRPADFHGHSMSVSDVVKIIKSDTIEPGCYFCDNFGWKELEVMMH